MPTQPSYLKKRKGTSRKNTIAITSKEELQGSEDSKRKTFETKERKLK